MEDQAKSNWEIGRDYERYIDTVMKARGSTKYQGALLGFDDLGRDIIARKDGKTEIIQWQLGLSIKLFTKSYIPTYGTSIEYQISQNSSGPSEIYFQLLFGRYQASVHYQPSYQTRLENSPKFLR